MRVVGCRAVREVLGLHGPMTITKQTNAIAISIPALF
jgi:hypothetical protein